MSDPTHVIRVSHKDLTRCDDCGRHVALEGEARATRRRDAIAAQACPFCGGALARGRDESQPVSLAARGLGRRSSRLAAGLLIASATLTGCPEDEPVDNPAGGAQQAGTAQGGTAQGGTAQGGAVQPAPDMGIGAPEYGVFPDPDLGFAQPVYGAFPDDLGAPRPAPDMDVSGPDYGVFPAPDMDIAAPEYGVFPDPDMAPPQGGAQGGAGGGG